MCNTLHTLVYHEGLYYRPYTPTAKSTANPYDCIIKHHHNAKFADALNEMACRMSNRVSINVITINVLVLDSIELNTTNAIVKIMRGSPVKVVIWVAEFANETVITNAEKLGRELSHTNITIIPKAISARDFIGSFTKPIHAFAGDFCGSWSIYRDDVEAFLKQSYVWGLHESLLWVTFNTRNRNGVTVRQSISEFKRLLCRNYVEASYYDISHTATKTLEKDCGFTRYSHSEACGCKRGQTMITMIAKLSRS